jgi:hypothetical protein
MAVIGSDASTPIDIVPGADLIIIFSRYVGTQLLTLTGGATGGTFTLTYRNAVTVALAYNANGATVQAALEALSTIKPNNVSVSGSAGGPWTVTPQGALKVTEFLQNLLTADLSGLTGGSGYHMAVSTPLLDVHTGYTYELQARKTAGSIHPDILINTAGDPNPGTSTVQGSIDLSDGAAGHIKATLLHAATEALDFSNTSSPGLANFVLMETHSGINAPLDEGQFRLKGKIFV